MGNEELSEEQRFRTLQARKENEDALDALVTAWTSRYTAELVMQLLQEAGVAAGVVENGEDLMDLDPQLKHRGTFIPLEYPNVGTVRSVSGAHFQLSKNRAEMRIAPKIGEHNEYVFKGVLGMSEAEYALLVKDGVIA
jgi:crotonobetainyl-CoA:carnitine CoA-transferase CaiB-like acyl-CoA transferase